MNLYFRSARFAAAAVVLGLCSFAAAQKSFVAPRALDINGNLVGITWDLTGGESAVLGTSAIGPIFGNLDLNGLYSFYGSSSVLQWLKTNMDGVSTPASCNMYAIQRGPSPIYSATGLVPDEIEFPAGNVDVKHPAGLRIASKSKTFTKKPDSQIASRFAQDSAHRQKAWLCSNFKVSLGDLPTDRVSRFDPITVDQMFVDRDGDGKPDLFYSSGDVTIYVPLADAKKYRDAVAAGVSKTYFMVLDYLDELGNPILSLNTSVQIYAVDFSDPFEDPSDPNSMAAVVMHTAPLTATTITLYGVK